MYLYILGGLVVLMYWGYQQKFVKDSYTYAGRKAAPIRSRVLPVPKRFTDILQKYFPYYQQLSHGRKLMFARRVTRFVYSKHYIPRQVDEVTIEAKVLIAACAVQLTFGLPDVYLQHFSRILVYPNDYYSSITRTFHKGEVNPRFGVIVLSWQSFIDGYLYPSDSRNLGLHEMAHALRLENVVRNPDYQFFDEDTLASFDAHARALCEDVVNWDDTFFRPYACANVHEFFAVAVEYFFERSQDFKDTLPELYSILTRLLHQDPLTASKI